MSNPIKSDQIRIQSKDDYEYAKSIVFDSSSKCGGGWRSKRMVWKKGRGIEGLLTGQTRAEKKHKRGDWVSSLPRDMAAKGRDPVKRRSAGFQLIYSSSK